LPHHVQQQTKVSDSNFALCLLIWIKSLIGNLNNRCQGINGCHTEQKCERQRDQKNYWLKLGHHQSAFPLKLS